VELKMAKEDVFDTFSEEVNKRHEEMFRELDKISIDQIKAGGVTLSFGGKTFKFTDLEIIPGESLEERIRNEYKDKLNSQQQKIREKINSKINQLLIMHQNKQEEYERKEKQLIRKYSESAMMPDIKKEHYAMGLSVIKGNSNDELLWIYKGKYNPRLITVYNDPSGRRRKAIPARLVNRMKKDVLFVIKTKGNKVLSVNISKLSSRGIEGFDHYHHTGSNDDCWGNWNHISNWKNIQDIISCARDAEAVLEVINQGSLAKRNPSNLPRIETILNAIKDLDDYNPSTVERENGNTAEEDVWQAV
jgi:hypothetical protein